MRATQIDPADAGVQGSVEPSHFSFRSPTIMTWLGTLCRQLLRSWAALVVLAAFVAVLFVQRGSRGLHLGLPYVYMTDEPHYLTALNSVLWDGDAELGNNYARTNWGHVDTGVHRAGQLIDHHTYVYTFVDAVYRHPLLFGSFSDKAEQDSAGRQRPRAKQIPASGVLPFEYSWHPTYPFFLVAPLLSVLPRTAVEPVVLVLISALTFLAALRFRDLCTALVPSALYADLAMLAVFLALRARKAWPGQHFHLYLVAYGVFRFAHEFMRATPRLSGGLTGYQWAALACVGLGAWGFWRRAQFATVRVAP